MALDSRIHIVNIGLGAARRNCRKISCRPDFQIHILGRLAHCKFSSIVSHYQSPFIPFVAHRKPTSPVVGVHRVPFTKSSEGSTSSGFTPLITQRNLGTSELPGTRYRAQTADSCNFLSDTDGQIRSPAGLAVRRESSNVCVIGVVRFALRRRTYMGFTADMGAPRRAENTL
jgi:hypothetical protein